MAIKDLALAYDGSPAAHSALKLAVRMAKKYNAEISAIHVYSPAKIQKDFKRWIDADVLKNIEEAAKEKVADVEKEFRDQVASLEFSGPVDWVVETGNPGIALARRGRFYDILITGQFARAIRREQGALQPEELIHSIGKPLIIVPENFEPGDFKETAAVAWDGSRSAARALSDAMQILETKRKLDILVIEGKKATEDPYAPLPASDIVKHLKKHGVEASEVILQPGKRTAAQTVLDHCRDTAPDLLVMGAFGRGKLGAMLFGSMTTSVLASMNVPVLVSH
ncbi:MAG: universal stress protein [Alphaproteobacteria bacterium]|nr:universal stress protein [Alphaproteobacteria bacterium]